MSAAGACIWVTGGPGAGKTSVATAVAAELRRRGRGAVAIDEVDARAHLRDEGDLLDAVAWLAAQLAESGVVIVVSVDAPERAVRDRIREQIPHFIEVFVDRGASPGYEEPFAPELRVPTHDRDVAASAAQVMSWLEDAGVA